MAFGSDESQLKIVIEAVNNAKSAFKEVENDLQGIKKEAKGLEELSSTFKKVGLGITAFGGALTGVLTTTGLYSARVEVLGTVMENIGKVSGISNDVLYEQEKIIRDLGITTKEAREILTLFMQGQLDVAQASKIARVAQDLAVIAGVNSSEAAKTLTEAIISQQPMLLKNFGIVKNLNEIYETYAITIGKTADDLTDIEKRQAMVNTILSEGGKVAGTYEAAMGDVGKQLTSLPRYIDEAKLAFGQAFLPVIEKVVQALTSLFKWFTSLSPETQRLATYIIMGVAAFALILGPILLLIGYLPALSAGFAIITGAFGLLMLKITLIIAAIGLLVAAGIWLYKNWDKVKDFFIQTWEGIKIIVSEVVNSIISFIQSLWNNIVNVFNEIGYFLYGVVLLWASILRPIWQPIVDATLFAFNWLKEQIQTISNFMSEVFAKLKEILFPIWQGLMENIKEVWNAIAEYFSSIWESIKNTFSSAIEWLINKIQPLLSLVDRVQSVASSVSSSVGGFIQSNISAIRDIGKSGYMPFQEGGIVPGAIGAPVPALVHGGETIIPAGKSLGNIYLTITGNTFMSDRQAAEQIFNSVLSQLKKQTRLWM